MAHNIDVWQNTDVMEMHAFVSAKAKTFLHPYFMNAKWGKYALMHENVMHDKGNVWNLFMELQEAGAGPWQVVLGFALISRNADWTMWCVANIGKICYFLHLELKKSASA